MSDVVKRLKTLHNTFDLIWNKRDGSTHRHLRCTEEGKILLADLSEWYVAMSKLIEEVDYELSTSGSGRDD